MNGPMGGPMPPSSQATLRPPTAAQVDAVSTPSVPPTDLREEYFFLILAVFIGILSGLTGAVDVEPLRNLPQAVQDLYILASPQSPMRDLLAAWAAPWTAPPPPPEREAFRISSRRGAARWRSPA